jgi:hypothetical protein
MNSTDLLDCVFASWSPQIGDPTVMGWLTVAAYVIASGLAASLVAKFQNRPRVFWLALSVLLLALSVNKQLDLQSAFTAAGRCVAKAQGWYSQRGTVQVRFILAVMFGGLLVTLVAIWTMRRYLAETWLAILGLGVLLTFIAVRAAGFHHFDRFLGHEVGGVRMNWLLELGGIGLIAMNAVYLLMQRRRPSASRSVH